jgi:YidC/Oxa1 family membrane protein insertase
VRGAIVTAIQKRKSVKEGKVPPASQDTQQKVMQYVFPLMIGVFAFQFPAAVSLYWGVSTLFAIGQQLIVNREHLKV